jgi:hypothetical protein
MMPHANVQDADEPMQLTIEEEREIADRYRAIPRDATRCVLHDGSAWDVVRDWRVVVRHGKNTPVSTGRHLVLAKHENTMVVTVWDAESHEDAVMRARCQFMDTINAMKFGEGEEIKHTDKASKISRELSTALKERHATVYFVPDKMVNIVPDRR